MISGFYKDGLFIYLFIYLFIICGLFDGSVGNTDHKSVARNNGMILINVLDMICKETTVA
jgi:hypothetical protein